MKFIEVIIAVDPDFSEILIAELNDQGYDSFSESESGIIAYVEASIYNEQTLQLIQQKYEHLFPFTFAAAPLTAINWNEEWESNFQPVEVDGRCIIRASFHAVTKKYEYDIIINPKMSFGTGHHETTYMMIGHLLENNILQKTVMDAGCGTGILSIMAAKRGAEQVTAFDIEDWAFKNAVENFQLNDCSNIQLYQGTVNTLNFSANLYDIILANINKNVLLEEISVYSQLLKNKGVLIMSGFYEEDVSDINQIALKNHLSKTAVKFKNNWASLVYEKTFF